MYIGNQPYQSAFLTDLFSGNGGTTFTMSVAPANTASVLVAVSGVLQSPDTYAVVGTTLTFTQAPPTGTGNISARYLGIPASGVTTTAYRTVTTFTATASQTTFTPPSYTVGFINVYRNGVLLTPTSDYTASNGTTVVLASGAASGDTVIVESFLVSSVLNAIPNTSGSISQSNLPANIGATGPAFGAYASGTVSVSANTNTKIPLNTKEFDTNTNFDNTTNYRFTPSIAGYYQINGAITYAATSSSSYSYIFIGKNGSTYKWGSNVPNNSSNYTETFVSCVVYLNGSTDYIELYGFINGATVSTVSGQAYTYLNGSLVRSA